MTNLRAVRGLPTQTLTAAVPISKRLLTFRPFRRISGRIFAELFQLGNAD